MRGRLCAAAAWRDIIGVRVSETTAETRIVTAKVTANSRNKPADDVAHEQQRNQHGDQRNGQRDDGEADLPGALERRLQRRFAFFQVAIDVLDHDDGVVHHETGGDRQRHQSQVVQAVAQQVHHAERADQGKRHGDAGNHGGGQVPQEKKITITTRPMVSIISNCTSSTEARMVCSAVGENREPDRRQAAKPAAAAAAS